MREENSIILDKRFFTTKEEALLVFHGLKASLFTYKSGINAVRLQNEDGYIIMLPFKGQQIWDAVFGGRSLKMDTILKEPIETDFFLNSYSCLMMHCGALRMGCPGPQDTHPLHGELPYADFQHAEIVFGEDDNGVYIGLSGIYEHKPAFAPNYNAKTLVKLYKQSDVLEISIEIQNLLHRPMELMYMCHINFRTNNNSSLVQSLGWTEKDMVLSIEHLHERDKLSTAKLKQLDRLRHDPKLTQTIRKKDIFDPEINYFLKKPQVDKNGYAHFLQILADGTGNYVSYQPKSLNHAVRWLWKNEDYDILGLVLP